MCVYIYIYTHRLHTHTYTYTYTYTHIGAPLSPDTEGLPLAYMPVPALQQTIHTNYTTQTT